MIDKYGDLDSLACEHEFEDGVCIWCGEEEPEKYNEDDDEFYYYEDDIQKEIEKEEDK